MISETAPESRRSHREGDGGGSRPRHSPEDRNGRPTEPPNVAVVVLDTTRAKETVPADPTITPALAALAAAGTEYTNAFTSAPWTLPSHASLFTGTFPTEHGAHGDRTHLDDALPTLAEAFAGAGYETVGVSNNRWITEEFGFDRGFETFRTGRECGPSAGGVGAGPFGRVRSAVTTLAARTPLVADEAVHDPAIDDGAARSTDWIEGWLADRTADRPFFLFANYIEPHAEYRPSRAVAERFLPDDADYETAMAIRQDPRAYDAGQYDLTDRERRLLRGLYRAEIASVDAHLGRIADAVAADDRETVLVVLGDHGENIGEHGLFGHQYSVADTVLHVPLVIHGGVFADGDVESGLVQPLDLAPTLLDAAGIDTPRFRDGCRGRSLHPAADGPAREAVFAEYIAPQPSVATLEARFGTLPARLADWAGPVRVVRTAEEKLVRRADGTTELYAVGDDPAEVQDVADDRPERVAALDDRLDRWRASLDPATTTGRVAMTDATKQRLTDLGYR